MGAGVAGILAVIGEGKRATLELQNEEIRRKGVVVRSDVIRGTAEFINRYRRQLRRAGCIDFELPRGKEMPPWIAVVFDTLALRPRTWRVTTMRSTKGGKKVRVHWRRWGEYTLRGRGR